VYKTRQPHGLLPACCGLELCWLCAGAQFLASTTANGDAPLLAACGAFLLALVIAGFFKARPCRMVWVWLVHLLGVSLLVWAANPVPMGLAGSFSIFQWYKAGLAVSMVCLFWYKGTTLALRQLSYKTVCNHFDLGIAMIFLVLIIKLLLTLKVVPQAADSFILVCMGGVFVFGLAAIFLSHTPATSGEKLYVKGFQVYGAMITAGVVLAFTGLMLTFVLLPFMTRFAESGYHGLKQVAGPLSPYLISILRFVLSGNRPMAVSGSSNSRAHSVAGNHLPQEAGSGFESIVFYGLAGVFVIAGVWFFGYLVYLMFRYLLSKPSEVAQGETVHRLFLGLIGWLVSILFSIHKLLPGLTESIRDAKKGYACLVRWGEKSGLPRLTAETPMEYARRLGQRFWKVEREICMIVHAFHLEAYGEVPLDVEAQKRLRSALKTIHHPSFWPMRIQSFFYRE